MDKRYRFLMDLHLQAPERPKKIFRLRAVTARLKAILLESTDKVFWVQAQLVPGKAHQRGGHFYGEFVEVDPAGKQVAKIRVVIWRAEYEKIRVKLLADGQADAL